MSNVIAMPSRVTGQHYTVGKDRGAWAVQLVTPAPGEPLRTVIAWHSAREIAFTHGREVALRMQRPFKTGRARQ